MIKLDELKPIIEPLCTDENAADIIAAVTALDVHDEATAVAEAVAANDAKWNRRFKETFFSAHSGEENAEGEPAEDHDEEDSDDELLTLDELIYKED